MRGWRMYTYITKKVHYSSQPLGPHPIPIFDVNAIPSNKGVNWAFSSGIGTLESDIIAWNIPNIGATTYLLDLGRDMTSKLKQFELPPPPGERPNRRLDILLVGAWGLSVWARESLISTEFDPSSGNSTYRSILLGLDQTLAKSPEWAHFFDLASDLGQASMAALVVLSPWWLAGSRRAETRNKEVIIPSIVRLFRAAAINGVLLEWVRIAVQRPRPYVADKALSSTSPLTVSDFTSFYSGHTSFSFAALAILAWTIREEMSRLETQTLQRRQHYLAILTLGLTIALATGIMRVLAGRHHPSDVLTGALMGLLCGLITKKLSTRT